MVISLPEPVHASAELLAARAGFKTVEEYLADLVRRDQERLEKEDPDYLLRRAMAGDGNPASVSEEALRQRKQEIEALLVEGLESGPAGPMTTQDWEDIRQEVRARRERRQRS